MPLHGPILQLLVFINPPDKTQHRGEKNLFTHKVSVKVAQSCPILCDPVDGSPPGSEEKDTKLTRDSYALSLGS